MAEGSEVAEEQNAVIPVASPPPPLSPAIAGRPPIDASSFTHTPFYCEENVYLLCKRLSEVGLAHSTGSDLFAVFISNEGKKVPLWYQKASKRMDGLVIWDYHVICIQLQRNREGSSSHLVWDLDSSLHFPFPLDQYFMETFQPMLSLRSTYSRFCDGSGPQGVLLKRASLGYAFEILKILFENGANLGLFRVVHAPLFGRCFASDRSHMRDPLGNWIALPPKYDPIVAEDGAVNNLDGYLQMRDADVMTDLKALIDDAYFSNFGVVMHESMLESFFSKITYSEGPIDRRETNGTKL